MVLNIRIQTPYEYVWNIMKAYKIVLLVVTLLLAECQKRGTEEKITDTETITSTLSEWDTYTNLDSLMTSYQIATSSNVRSTLAKERIYLIDDDNPWDTALVNIRVREGYFACIYDNDFTLYTHRLSNGKEGLDFMVKNNPGVLTKEINDSFEYYYSDDGVTQDYLWIQDETYLLELNVPTSIEFNINEVLSALNYQPLR